GRPTAAPTTSRRCSSRGSDARESSSDDGAGHVPGPLARSMSPVRSPHLRRSTSVALRLRPTDTSFYELFAASAQHIGAGAGLLAEMVTEEADREQIAKQMRETEHLCDENTHEIVRRANSSFVTPFDRSDLYALASG